MRSLLDPDNPQPRKDKPDTRHLEIAPVVRLDTDALLASAAEEVDAFIAECEELEVPKPDRQAILDRMAALAANIDPNAAGGINSLEANRRFVLEHQRTAPYFSVGTEP